MAKEIAQKLGFNASGALRTLTTLKTKLDDASTSLANFKNKGGGSLAPVEKSIGKATKKTQEFALSWQTIGRILQTQIMLRSINALTSAIGDGVERARELGLRIAEIQTIGQGLNMTSSDLLSKVIQTSGEVAGTSAAQFAEGLYQTISNQVVELGD